MIRTGWAALTDFGQLLVFGAVSVLLSAALVLMAQATGGEVRVTVAEPTAAEPTSVSGGYPLAPEALFPDLAPPREVRAWVDEGEGAVRSSARSLPLPSATPHELAVAPAEAAGSALTADDVYDLALAVSGSPVWALQAVAVVMCESNGSPSAVGALGEQGLGQVRPEYHGRVSPEPTQQIAQMFGIWEEWGWAPWSCAR